MQTADHILIPLLDGQHALAQIARVEDDRALLYLTRTVSTPEALPKALSEPQVVSVQCVAVADLPTKNWRIIGYEAVPRIDPYLDTPLFTMDTQDPTLIEALVNAIQGLYPWDGFPDADVFTNMLRAPSVLPLKARFAADFPKPESL